MSKPMRMHPAATIFNFLRIIKDVIIPAIIGFFATFSNINLGGFWFEVLYIVLFLVITITYSFLSWYRFTYRVEDDELKIEYGIIVRKKRYISKNRIQSIDLTAGIIHRIFGLVRVEVQTAGSDNAAEAGLKAVTRQNGELLRETLKNRQEPVLPEEDQPDDEKVPVAGPTRKIDLSRLLIAATTSGGVGVFLSLFALGGSQLNQVIPDDFFMDIYNWAVHLSIYFLVSIIFFVFVVLWLMAIAGTILKYSYFTIQKNSEEVYITRGLLEKKQLTVPLKRIQGIRIQENVLRQPFGYAAVYAEVAGGSADKDEEFSTVLFPLLKQEEIAVFISQFVPDYSMDVEWNPLPKRSARRFIIRAVLPVLIVVSPLVYFFPFYSWVLLFVLLAAGLLGYFRYKDAGYIKKADQLAFRYRNISRETIYTKRKRIQSLSTSVHWFQSRRNLKTAFFSIASHTGMGKSFKVKDIEDSQAESIIDWYSFERE
ncbi:PH domain-containing protein [Sediminibacillus massiliensis]|uniref:PH domain-containing protein n=1 Tax=Sediminibacillus massiliensis TaxID=1926277 RepID=UPI0015C38D81|nr:PH domain-containing protein [Sediminibacillus massiliensis]